MNIADIRPLHRNPRKINDAAFRKLCESIQRDPAFMPLRPLVVDDDGVILAGNQRWRACKALGMTEIPDAWVVKASALTPEQRKRFVLVDNAPQGMSGEWDMDVLAAEWMPAELDLLGWDRPPAETNADTEPAIDRAAELNATWQVKAGDLWRIGPHRMVCGDATRREDVAKVLRGDGPGIMVTDPPYGVEYDPNWRNEADRASGKPYGARAVGKVTSDDRHKWSAAYTLAQAPVAYVWHAGIYSADVARDLEAAGFDIRSSIIWAKTCFAISQGHYHWAHEPCWYAVKKGASAGFIGNRKQTTIWADIQDTFKHNPRNPLYATQIDPATIYAFTGDCTTVWSLRKDKPCEGGHSTQKPLECMARPIRNHDAAIVYDPFLGTGTTMVAAHNLHRTCLGLEFSPNYCAVILERMSKTFLDLEIKRA